MNALLKRIFDIVGSAIAILLLLPAMLAIALLVKFDSPGPALFRQRRLGRGERLFEMYKFRTMRIDGAEKGPSIKLLADSRVTHVGRILRRFDLDELPNLFNVLKGDMSIVGPRPEVPKYLQYYTADQKRVFSAKPGLTDLGTLAFRNEATLLAGEDPEQIYIKEILPRKILLNLEYIRRQSVLCDLGIILRTLVAIPFQSKE